MTSQRASSLRVRLPKAALEEIHNAVHEAHERQIIGACEHALASGGATPPNVGSNEHLDLTTIAVGELKRALDVNAELGGADSEKGSRLVNNVRVIKLLREALAAELWERVNDIIGMLWSSGMMHHELTAARVEYRNMSAIQALESALSHDSASGNGELLGNPSVAVGKLDEAIDNALCIDASEAVKELSELIQCAQCIRDIRWALQKSDLEALGFALGYSTEIEPEDAGTFKSKNFGVGWTPKSRAEFLQAKHEFMDALVAET